jgi:hypothetical protein
MIEIRTHNISGDNCKSSSHTITTTAASLPVLMLCVGIYCMCMCVCFLLSRSPLTLIVTGVKDIIYNNNIILQKNISSFFQGVNTTDTSPQTNESK